MAEGRLGVLGASSLVGQLVLDRAVPAGHRVVAFSRTAQAVEHEGCEWRVPGDGPSPPAPFDSAQGTPLPHAGEGIEDWIVLAPIWVLPDYFAWLESQGARRVVALSSTSRFSKTDSSDAGEQAIAQRLAQAEDRLREWAEGRGAEWIILRPTLIYGLGRDRNITEIGRFIRRFGFFPLLGRAAGLRQPVHAADVAGACLAVLSARTVINRAYNLSGGETLSYRAMVGRIFAALQRPARVLPVPLAAFRFAVTLLRVLPRYRHWSVAMAERMNRDLVFDHDEAARDFGFRPRGFEPGPEDLPA